jgi:uncharacterized protein (DUF58 family)
LTLMLVVDLSGSGLFGSRDQSKRELAAELASVLAFSAIRNNDKVGLILFTEEVEKYIPPKKGRRHVLRVIREILMFQPAKRGTNFEEALQVLNRLARRHAIVVVISDFLFEQRPAGEGGKRRLSGFANAWASIMARPAAGESPPRRHCHSGCRSI